MTLGDKQKIFAHNVGRLIMWAYEAGYELTLGEALRTPEQAAWNAQNGTGIAHSLHIQRLAIDFNLFRDGIYLRESSDYAPMGEYWKSLHPANRWGGDWTKRDGNHFEHDPIGG